MKFFLFLYFYIYGTKCQNNFLEYYTNYTFISPSASNPQTYFFYPHYEVGTAIFIVKFSPRLNCNFTFYDGNTYIDSFINFYTSERSHVLKIPSTIKKPTVLTLRVTNPNHNFPYYLYFYNPNYTIPLSISNYYFYLLSIKNLEIKYEISSLKQDIYLNFQSIIEYPEFHDNINIILNDGEIEHFFNEKTSSFSIKLKKNENYKLNLKCIFSSPFTNKTAILIYFGDKEQNNFRSLYYNNNIISYQSIFENNKIYLIDSINLIDEHNSYKFYLNEKSESTDLQNLKINVHIKKFPTYNSDFIKNNTPTSDEQYDESYIFEQKNSFEIQTSKYLAESEKTILIYIEINYKYENNPLYEFSIQTTSDEKELEFKSYLVNLYTQYNFSSLKVYPTDFVFISTNHSNTIYPILSKDSRIFSNYYNGYLYVSNRYISEGDNILINYDDQKLEKINEEDMGYFQIYKFNNDNSNFESIDINDDSDCLVYHLELKKNIEKFFYVKINNKNDYYVMHESNDKYSFLKIDQMPINIRDFSQNNTNDEIKLISYQNEYIFKIGYSKAIYNLVKLFLIKNEKSYNFDISEGQNKIYTFPQNANKINLNIELDSKKLTSKTFINLKIPSKYIEDNLYIQDNHEKNGQKYLLNNSGINIYYIKDESINLNIIKPSNLNRDIPILINMGINIENINSLNHNQSYKFYSGQVGILRFYTRRIDIKIETPKRGISMYYYKYYLSDEILNNAGKLLSPEIFEKHYYNTYSINFIEETDLELEKIVRNNNNDLYTEEKLSLYLIFSFETTTNIYTGSENKPNTGDNENFSGLVITVVVVFTAILIAIFLIIFYLYYKKKKNNKNLKTIFIDNTPTTSEGENASKNYFYKPEEDNYPNENEIQTNKGDINNVNNIDNNLNDPDLPAPLPYIK